MKPVVWLASFPKSGNTWFRIFLGRLLRPEGAGAPETMGALEAPIASGRRRFDMLLGVPSALLTRTEVDALRPDAHRELAQGWREPLFVRKVHDAYTRLPDGRPLFGEAPDASAILLLRDPADVAVSFAHSQAISLDESVERLLDPDHAMAARPGRLNQQVAHHLGRWDQHALSWLDAPMPIHVMRYEDMRAAPLATFRGAVRFLGLDRDDAAITAALDAARFEKLQRAESKSGFREAVVGRAFFRAGRTGDGAALLSPDQLARLGAMRDTVDRVLRERGLAA